VCVCVRERERNDEKEMYLQLCLHLIFWNCFESTGFNFNLFLFFCGGFSFEPNRNINSKWENLSCATVGFSKRYKVTLRRVRLTIVAMENNQHYIF
jgi:hypothetical protein